MIIKYILQGLDCANCAMKIEKQLNKMEEINSASVNFANLLCVIDYKTYNEDIEQKVIRKITELEDEVTVIKKTGENQEAQIVHENGEGGSCKISHHHDDEEDEHEEHHHHHHDHESCGCGHDHHHEHHHDHDHEECGCHHDHSHHDHQETAHKEVRYLLKGLDCANCAMKIEKNLNKMPIVETASVDFATLTCAVTYHEYNEEHEKQVMDRIVELEDEVEVIKKEATHHHEHHHDHECGCGHDHHHHDHEHHHEHGDSCSLDYVPSNRPQTGKHKWKVTGLDCANCALKIEDKLNELDVVKNASLNFTTGTLLFDLKDGVDEKQAEQIMKQTILEAEDEVQIETGKPSEAKNSSNGVKEQLIPILIGAVLLVAGILLKENGVISLICYLAAYLVTGWKVLKKAIKNIRRGEIFDENFLMGIATVGALAIGDYTEAVAVLIFYEVGEMFQSFSVGKSR